MSTLTPFEGYIQHGEVTPDVDLDSRDWWAAVSAGRFLLPACGECGYRWFPPTPRCPRCASASVRLESASPRGSIYSWIVVHRALDEAFLADTPYTVVAVDLEDGARMFGRLLDGEPAPGRAVEARSYIVGTSALLGFAGA
jgi:uncharacterized OB-fold protein